MADFVLDVLSHCPEPLRSFEQDALKDFGPQVSTSWNRYADERYYPHLADYYRTVDDVTLVALFDLVDELLKPWIVPLFPASPHDVFARRSRTSNLGPSYCKSLDELEDYEYQRVYGDLISSCQRMITFADSGLVDLPFDRLLCIPGVRISNAPIDAAGEDQNRVILMIDFPGYMALGCYMYPVYNVMKTMPVFSNIWFRDVIPDMVKKFCDGYTFIGADSSRMDQRLQYEPYGTFFSRFMCKFFPAGHHKTIESLIYHHHHPVTFVPEGIVDGSIGNPSGAVSTTAENSYITFALQVKFLLDIGYTPDDLRRMMFKDIACLAHGDDAAIAIPNDRVPASPAKRLAKTWRSMGFKAKPEKQYVSFDTLLFLKKYWSNDPNIGMGTMTLSNVFKKLVYRSPESANFAFWDLQVDVRRNQFTLDLEKIRKADVKARTWYGQYRDGGKPPGVQALWPYYQSNIEINQALSRENWSGQLGPIVISDVERSISVLTANGVTTDDSILSVEACIMSLKECWTHPLLPRFTEFIAVRARKSIGKHMAFWNRRDDEKEAQAAFVAEMEEHFHWVSRPALLDNTAALTVLMRALYSYAEIHPGEGEKWTVSVEDEQRFLQEVSLNREVSTLSKLTTVLELVVKGDLRNVHPILQSILNVLPHRSELVRVWYVIMSGFAANKTLIHPSDLIDRLVSVIGHLSLEDWHSAGQTTLSTYRLAFSVTNPANSELLAIAAPDDVDLNIVSNPTIVGFVPNTPSDKTQKI